MCNEGRYENFGAENIVKELSSPISLLLPTDQVSMNESFECHVADG
jgi:hypothetical protein